MVGFKKKFFAFVTKRIIDRPIIRENRKQSLENKETCSENKTETKLKAMKTTNKIQKTENMKLKNTITKTFAVVASLVLISLTVSANGFWRQIFVNNAYGKMAVLMINEANAPASPLFNQPTAGSLSNASLFETAKEAELPIEKWMTDNKYFRSDVFNDQISPEKSLEIESWMLDNPYFSKTEPQPEMEPALQIESWMTNPVLWGNSN